MDFLGVWNASARLPADQVFLVGGAVRDLVLGKIPKDFDYVVVGATPASMLELGFSQVGKDFPVFLDPDLNEEYALARVERKVGTGYHGFAVSTDGVSLEEDLGRRDLTINAMALDAQGQLHDPHGGMKDVQAKLLRHVGPAFADDPLRVLRVARFSARMAPEGFVVADETMALMRTMVAGGEIDALTPERVWKEVSRALACERPSVFFEVLRACGALAVILPEVDALFGVPQTPLYHPEIDTGVHTMMVVDMAARLAPGNVEIAFAALAHDLGKALTPPEQWPKHVGHEKAGVAPLEGLAARWALPKSVVELAKVVCEHHLTAHQSLEVRTGTLLNLLNVTDAWRMPERFEAFVVACEADKRGRTGMTEDDYPQARLLRDVCVAARAVKGRDLDLDNLGPEDIRQKIRDARLRAIRQAQGCFFAQQKADQDLTEAVPTGAGSSAPSP